MEVRNSQFAAFIDVFTPNTYVMVIMSDPTIRKLSIHPIAHLSIHPFFISLSSLASAATLVNVRNARKHFEKIEKMEAGAPIAQTFPS